MAPEEETLRIRIPAQAAAILQRLRSCGHRAYAVGGCVRDSLLGRDPNDWDICTSALPEEMKAAFRGWHLVETGLQHGTLTVVLDHQPYEVTTFRVDGPYTDHRHPDGVLFVNDVQEDLARRDFTVNAMAWNPEEGLVDAFGGREDLAAGRIRCVGKPAERFGEDALRILRALRFASTYGFAIEEGTAAAVRAMASDIMKVAPERIRVELSKLLTGEGAGGILRDYADVVTAVLPELKPMVGFDQRTPYHRWDVWEHTVRTVAAVRAQEPLRWAMLLHDSGKPAAFTLDERGVGHAYGHQKLSAEIADRITHRLRFDNATRERVLLLTARHDIDMRPEVGLLLRQLNRFGEENLRDLIEVHRADRIGKGTEDPAHIEAWAADMHRALDALLEKKPCFTLRQLAVHGGDLIEAGMKPGAAMGELLERLLEAVMDGRAANEKEALMRLARSEQFSGGEPPVKQ